MKLFNDISTLAGYLPRLNLKEISSIDDVVESALLDHLYPYTGFLTCSQIIEESPHDPGAFVLLQRCAAYYTAFDYLQGANVAMSGLGINQYTGSNSKPATYADRMDTLNFYADKADRALEHLLSHLEGHPGEYPHYTPQTSTGLLIRSAEEFTRYFNIANSRRTYLALTADMLHAQMRSLRPVLGSLLYQILIDRAAGKDVSLDAHPCFASLSAEQAQGKAEEIHAAASAAIAHQSIAYALPRLTLRMRDAAVCVSSFYSPTPSERAALDSTLEVLTQGATQGAAGYLEDLSKLIAPTQDIFIKNDKTNKHYKWLI